VVRETAFSSASRGDCHETVQDDSRLHYFKDATMKSFRVLLAAVLLLSCPWHDLGAQDDGRSHPTLAAPSKTVPAGNTVPRSPSDPGPFEVVPKKKGEVLCDLCISDRLGIKAFEIKKGDPDWIKKVAPNGQAFKWVLTPAPESKLWGIPILEAKLDLTQVPADGNSNNHYATKDDVAKHVIATGGLPVQTAGVAQIQGRKIVIDCDSGHYQPTPLSVRKSGVPAFQGAGFPDVEPRDFEHRILQGRKAE
jgi:hypothetical protein